MDTNRYQAPRSMRVRVDELRIGDVRIGSQVDGPLTVTKLEPYTGWNAEMHGWTVVTYSAGWGNILDPQRLVTIKAR